MHVARPDPESPQDLNANRLSASAGLMFADRAVAICERELRRWRGRDSRADLEPYAGFVGEYWLTGLNIPRRDGTTVYFDKANRHFRPPWSAAFVSYVYRLAGIGENFLYHEAHVHYVVKALHDAQTNRPAAFYAHDPLSYQPKAGDLIAEVRGGRVNSLDALARLYGSKQPPSGAFIPMHCDVVVELDYGASELRTIGGNLFGGKVADRVWRLKPEGVLEPTDRLLCVLECML